MDWRGRQLGGIAKKTILSYFNCKICNVPKLYYYGAGVTPSRPAAGFEPYARVDGAARRRATSTNVPRPSASISQLDGSGTGDTPAPEPTT